MARNARLRTSQRVQRSKRDRYRLRAAPAPHRRHGPYRYPVSERELFILTYDTNPVPDWNGDGTRKVSGATER